jgi:aldehyde dehydrogenase (NAD+)
LIERDGEYLAALESREGGKPLWFSTGADLDLTIKFYRYMAGWADKIHGQTIPIGSNHLVYTRKEPVGVVG